LQIQITITQNNNVFYYVQLPVTHLHSRS